MNYSEMASYEGTRGMWMVYDRNPLMPPSIPALVSVHSDIVRAVEALSTLTDSCRLGFLPNNVAFHEAVENWENKDHAWMT